MFLVTFLACLAAAVAALPNPSLGESKLLQAMLSTSELQQSDPGRSLACFQYYGQVFDQLLQVYEQEYQACQNSSQEATATLDWVYKTRVSILGQQAQSACHLIEACDSQQDTGAILSCYTNVGASDAKAMYNISSTASQLDGQYQQQLQAIQFKEEQCSNAAKRDYEIGSEKSYVNLQSCLLGNGPVPTASSVPPQKTTAQTQSGSTGAYTTSSLSVSSTTITQPSPSRRTTTPRPISSTTPSRDSGASSTLPVPLSSTRGPIISTTRPVPLAKTSTIYSATPTTSAAPGYQPNLSSDLKKLLHSLLH